VVIFVQDQNISFGLEIPENGLFIVYPNGLVSGHESGQTPAWIWFVCARPNGEGMLQHVPEKRIDKVSFSLVLEGLAGTDPAEFIGQASGNQFPGE